MKNKNAVLKQYFGYEEFREGQEVLIDSILEGKDTLGIMPTGAGKSICYQVPALILEGITIVVSPLISLMKDQVGALNQAGVHAAFINSSLTANQCKLALHYARQGRYKIIYVAPERLLTEDFLEFTKYVNIAMVTVDEAHCISHWGQDFRPSYLKIVKFIEELPKRPIVSAYTATATKEVKEDMICTLQLQEPTVLTTGFDRKNLFFGVKKPKDKYIAVKECMEKHKGESGIIYCNTRKNVEEVYEKLVLDGCLVTKYHAGLGEEERKINQDDFIYDRKPIMVATNAFGMGIDKSNVKYIIHYNMPKNIESYYQEAGRAGRDGEEAECILLYHGQDVATSQYMIENNKDNMELTIEKDRERLKKMTFYCHTNECLRAYLLNYFGEYGEYYCGKCSNCLTQFEEQDVTEESKKVIGCIEEAGQRYGIQVIVQTLIGSDTVKIRQYGMKDNSYYGALSGYTQSTIKNMIQHLLMKEYLYQTNDGYAILKCAKEMDSIINQNEKIKMKLVKEEREEKVINQNTLNNTGMDLFAKLRALRYQLAKEEKVPPYLIFSDKTLTDMCKKCPVTKEEMLQVTGVGEAKQDKYGGFFIQEIKTFFNGERIETYDKELEERTRNSSNEFAKRGKQEFILTLEGKERMIIKGNKTITQLVEQINELAETSHTKKLTTTKITNQLLEKGYLKEILDEQTNRNKRVPTEKGEGIGMFLQKQVSAKGYTYEVVYYEEKAQEFVVEKLL